MKFFIAGGHYLSKTNTPPDGRILIQKLIAKGFVLTDNSLGSILLEMDHNGKSYNSFIRGGGKIENAYLIRMETDSVLPLQYSPDISKLYNIVFTLGARNQHFGQGKYLGHPLTFRPFTQIDESDSPYVPIHETILQNRILGTYEFLNWERRSLTFVAICSNKVGHSLDSNYFHRANFLRHMEDREFYLFGPLWDGNWLKLLESRIRSLIWALRSKQLSNFRSYFFGLNWNYPRFQGLSPNKYETIRKSKFYFVFENSDNFITEKLLEALICGSIPVYFGGAPQDFGIPSSVYLQFDKAMAPKEVISKLRSLSLDELQIIKENIGRFIESQDFLEKWTAEGVYSEISSIIDEDYSKRHE